MVARDHQRQAAVVPPRGDVDRTAMVRAASGPMRVAFVAMHDGAVGLMQRTTPRFVVEVHALHGEQERVLGRCRLEVECECSPANSSSTGSMTA